MTFSIPPRAPPPPRLLRAKGEVLQRVVLYAPSSVLRFFLFFLLIAIRLLPVLAVRFRVVLPGVPLMSLLAKGRIAFLGILGARCSDPVRGCKALHMQRGVGASATHVLCAAFAAMCTSAPLGAGNGDVDFAVVHQRDIAVLVGAGLCRGDAKSVQDSATAPRDVTGSTRTARG